MFNSDSELKIMEVSDPSALKYAGSELNSGKGISKRGAMEKMRALDAKAKAIGN